jgi:hypothetical protein
MEKTLILQTEQYISKFKSNIQKKAVELSFNEKDKIIELLEFIFEYEKISFGSSKISTINENSIATSESTINITDDNRCIATRKQGDRCTRKKTKGNQYCGTHCVKYKPSGQGTTHSTSTTKDDSITLPFSVSKKSLEVIAHEIQGIIYYIDNDLNVYNTEDIFKNINNPRIIAKAVRLSQNVFSIPSLGL